MQNQSNREITFDTQLKTALWACRVVRLQFTLTENQRQMVKQLAKFILLKPLYNGNGLNKHCSVHIESPLLKE